MAMSYEKHDPKYFEYLTKAIERDSHHLEALWWRGQHFREKELFEDAARDIDLARDLNPNHVDILIESAWIKNGIGEYEEATRFFEKAIDVLPHRALTFAELGKCQSMQKQYLEATESLSRALTIEPGVWHWHKARAVSLFHLSRFSDAMLDLRKAYETNPADSVR